jgi:type IV pilus assembly protein PilC
VAKALVAQQLSPIDIQEGLTAPSNFLTREIRLPVFAPRIKLKDLAIMSRQMTTMIQAGLSLMKTLSILVEQTENKTLARALADVRLDVEAGLTLSASLNRHPEVFPDLMTSLVRAGEAGGFLDKALDSVAQTLEADAKLRSTIRSAMTYPIAVLMMAIVGVVVMLIFIVPIFDKMFKDLGGALPWPTQMLVWLSPVVAWLTPVLIVAIVIFMGWWRRHKNDEAVRRFIDPIKLKIPIFGPLNTKIAIARFSRNFSSMIGAGVPILHALGVVGRTSGNWVVEQAVVRVQESVRLGATVAAPLSQEKVFPPMVTQMVAVGEDAGSLEVMLSKVADFYDQEIDATTSQLTSLIEPVMIAFIGVIIGGMIITLYLPIFTIFNEIR